MKNIIRAILLLAISVIATITIALRSNMGSAEFGIIAGIILLGIIAIAGIISGRKWGNGLTIVTLSVTLLNFLYLLFNVNVGVTFLAGFVAALVGLVLALAKKEPSRKKTRAAAPREPIMPPQEEQGTTRKKVKKAGSGKKVATKKKTATKKKATTKKTSAQKKTTSTKKKKGPGRPPKKKTAQKS